MKYLVAVWFAITLIACTSSPPTTSPVVPLTEKNFRFSYSDLQVTFKIPFSLLPSFDRQKPQVADHNGRHFVFYRLAPIYSKKFQTSITPNLSFVFEEVPPGSTPDQYREFMRKEILQNHNASLVNEDPLALKFQTEHTSVDIFRITGKENIPDITFSQYQIVGRYIVNTSIEFTEDQYFENNKEIEGIVGSLRISSANETVPKV
jgi:hypothetical protein